MSLLFCIALIIGQTAGDQPTPPPTGFWPTEKMLEGIVSRLADEKSLKFDLDESQAKEMRRKFVDRWSRFAKDRRTKLQPLIIEYLESQLAMQPPDTEAVASWSKRAMPMFDDLEAELTEMYADMREIVPPAKHPEMVKDALKTTAGLEAFRAKLRLWSEGQFEQREWWDLPPMERRKRREREAAAAVGPELPTEQENHNKSTIDTELDRWEQYVADFVKRYSLDDAQTESANSILRECKVRALVHKERHRDRIQALEKQIAEGAKSGDDKHNKYVQAETRALYGPVDEIFAEMQNRLQKLLTSAQSASPEPAIATP